MRYSQYFPKTVKEAPKDEVAINAKYLLRGGFIDKLMAGSYTLLPLGRIVERKIENIIREEMNATGAAEMLMPLLHPKEIWNETGRWDKADEVMYKLKKGDKEYVLSFTHEEIFLDVARKHLKTYRDLPLLLYHMSTKFRSELRVKSGILRGREFLMKDLYSLHTNEQEMNNYYWKVKDAYLKIFKRLNLDAVVVEAAGGVFTDAHTHEFQVRSEAGEDTIYFKKGWEYWKNKEIMTEEELKDPEIESKNAIEVGNIFRYGVEYSKKMDVSFTDSSGGKQYAWFGAYGIGITRLIGVLVEIFHDDKGIIWPEAVAPYHVHLIGLNLENETVKKQVEKVYDSLQKAGIEVLYDDRENVGPGEKFADADLLGVPVRLVVSLKSGDKVEWKKRSAKETELLTIEEIINKLKSK
ncbi:MAG TPA: aminoacyl--tRNA ligase-related protein [Patescibacteria group bacterium]|nr:aminoacyl--tRNA ligase-related protein [Patescibacteria group bacterium]